MHTHKKLQSAMELLTTYGFMLALATIILVILIYFMTAPPQIIQNSCSVSGSINCENLEYYSNSVSNTGNVIIYLSNAGSSPANIISVNVLVNGNYYYGLCTINRANPNGNTIVYPGGSSICITTTSLTALKPGTKINGQFLINMQVCNSGVGQLNVQECNFIQASTTGTFTTYSASISTNSIITMSLSGSNSIIQGTKDTITGSSTPSGDTVQIFYCKGTSCTPYVFLASGQGTAAYNAGALSGGTYTIYACDTNQDTCSASNVISVTPLLSSTTTT